MSPSLSLGLRMLQRNWARNLPIAFSVGLGVATLTSSDLISDAITAGMSLNPEVQAVTSFMSEQLNVGLTAIGLLISFAAAIIVFNTFLMAISQRRQDLACLRAVGMTQRQILRMVTLEAAITGTFGTLLGLPGGVVMSKALIGLMESTSTALNAFGDPVLDPGRFAFAGVLGPSTAILGALFPAWRAAQTPPVHAPHAYSGHAATKPRLSRSLLFSLIGAGMITLLFISPPGGFLQPPWTGLGSLLLILLWLTCVSLALPGWIHLGSSLLSKPLQRLLGVTGRLGAENSRRARSRVTYTVLTMAIGVAMIVAVAGYITFWFDELFFRTMEGASIGEEGVGIFPLDVEAGLQAYVDLQRIAIPSDLTSQLERTVEGRGKLAESYFVLAPELSFLGDSYFSFVLDPEDIQGSGGLFFRFTHGDWERAMPLMEEGCGLLVTPVVAIRNNTWLFDKLNLNTPSGPIECTIAGIGPTFVGASIIGSSVGDLFGLEAPVNLLLLPNPGVDVASLVSDLADIVDPYPGVWLFEVKSIREVQTKVMTTVKASMNAMILLAILAATLGVANTLLINLQERRREMATLRAIGATGKQVRTMISVEAVLMGLFGGITGLMSGAGIILVYALVVGGSDLGFPEFPIHEAALRSTRTGLISGMTALVLAPVFTGLMGQLITRRGFAQIALHPAEVEPH